MRLSLTLLTTTLALSASVAQSDSTEAYITGWQYGLYEGWQLGGCEGYRGRKVDPRTIEVLEPDAVRMKLLADIDFLDGEAKAKQRLEQEWAKFDKGQLCQTIRVLNGPLFDAEFKSD